MKIIVLKVIVLFCLTWFFIKTPVVSQELRNIEFQRLASENIKLEKGLSQNWVYSIIQDKYGYMWFGTWDGLNRYDGYNFVTYNIEDGLSDHSIYTLLEDNEGIIWIGTDKGFNRFDRKTRTFTKYFHNADSLNGLVNNRVNVIIQTEDSTIWIGTGSGLNRFDKNSEEFVSYFSKPQDFLSPRSNYIIDLYEDRNGIIWISTSFGLIKFDPATEISVRFYHIDNDPSTICDNNVRCVLQDEKGNYWVGTRNGLTLLDSSMHVIKHYFNDPDNPNSLSNNWVREIYEDSKGNIWIGTSGGGLNLKDKESDTFIRFKNALNDPGSLSNDKVYSIFEDKTGNIWVGTFKGVNMISKYYSEFKHCYRRTNDNSSISNNFVWTFTETADSLIWIGTSNGVNVLNTKTKKYFTIYRNNQEQGGVSGFDVRTILYTPGLNCMWFGTFGLGLYKYSMNTKELVAYEYSPNQNSIGSNIVNALLWDELDSSIWIGTGKGLCNFNPKTNRFIIFESDKNDPASISNNIVISVFKDSRNNIWVGTDNGLNRYDRKNNKFFKYFNQPGNEKSLSNNSVFCIFEDYLGFLWIGTSGGGLNKLNPQTGEFKVYTTEDGLPNNIIYAILEDDNDNFWISTNYGISKFNIPGQSFVNYDVKDGLQSNEFNLGAALKSSNGLFYFGGMNGYNVFNPGKIVVNPVKPIVVVPVFRMFNEIVSNDFFDGDTICLNYDDNFFSFEIAALDYTNPSKNKYKYKLENIDKDWVLVDAENRWAEYKKVRPGKYTFMADGSNNDGIWNEKGIKLTLVIKPPWWATWYFRVFLFLVLILIIYGVVYWKIRRMRRRHEMEVKLLEIEKQKFDLEQKALRLQINPHFIFNSLNSIQSYILENDIENAVFYLGKFSQLMRVVLSNTTNKYVSLKDELAAIRYYIDLEQLRFSQKFEYKIYVDPELDEEYVEIPPMIIQPYVENAIIHGLINSPDKGNLSINVKKKSDKSLLCIVKDDGIGREKAAEIAKDSGIKHNSRGMLITKARLEILNRQSKENFSVKIVDLRNNRNKPAGTEVRIIIHFREE
jgi:ligand-binding sensor domain-containing protein